MPEARSFAVVVDDFQAHPEWSLDRYDDYATWYMYGAALFLRYLDEERFTGDGSFLGEMWRRAAGAADFEDALDDMLGALAPPSDFAAEVVAFARWRYAEPLARGWPGPRVLADATNTGAMAYGTSYAVVPPSATSATVVVEGTGALVQALDATGAGAPAVVPGAIDVSGAAVVAVTVLPRTGEADAGARTDEIFAVHVTFP